MSAPTSFSENLPSRFMRPAQQSAIEQEIASCDQQIANTSQLEKVDKRKSLKRKRALQQDLDSQRIPDLSDAEKDILRAENRQIEEEVSSHMPTRDMMMRNPPGAVGHNIRFERAFKKKLLRWKRNQWAINPNSDDPDIANVERLRPDRDSLMDMSSAQIPPKAISMPSPQFMQNYDEISWETKSKELEEKSKLLDEKLSSVEALEEKLTKAMERVGAAGAAVSMKPPVKQPRRQMTEEQRKAAGERLARARAIKAAKTSTPNAEGI